MFTLGQIHEIHNRLGNAETLTHYLQELKAIGVETCCMLYSDERGVARIYQMSLEGGVWKMWRDSPGFSQRVTGTISGDGNTITWHGELSYDGSHWEQDLDVTYTRRP